MSTFSSFRNKWPFLVVGSFVFLASFFKIADLDFWWHLKTGQLIVQQKAFQHTEVYSYTAYGREYVDHEWLFQVIQYLTYAVAGLTGVILLKTALLICVYLLITRFLLRQGTDSWITIVVILLSIGAGRTRFIERPEVFTAFFLVCTYLLIDGYLKTGRKGQLLGILPVVVLWSNLHAAVILGLLLQLFFITAVVVETFLRKFKYEVFYPERSGALPLLMIIFLASIVLTGINPTGYRVLKVPFELTSIINSSLLNNQEWLAPSIISLPFYYVSLFFCFSVFLIHFRRLHFANFLFASFLAYISLKYVRNIGLFSICMPLVVAPYLPAISDRIRKHKEVLAVVSAALGLALFTLSPFEFGIGVSSYFPQRIAEFTKQKNLSGRMLNAYAFGGYFIWTLFPERRIFLDGRNEVYLPLLKEITEVRMDGRKWKKFLDKYRVDYALLNYVDELEEVTVMNAKNQPTKTYAPFTSTHFPRAAWALVYFDDTGMILIRRNGANRQLLPMEYTSVFPEGRFYHDSLLKAGRLDPTRAIQELTRKLQEEPDCKRARYLLQTTQSSVQ